MPSDDNGGLSVASSVIGVAQLSEATLLPLLRSTATTEVFDLPIYTAEGEGEDQTRKGHPVLKLSVSNRLQPKALSMSWETGSLAQTAIEHLSSLNNSCHIEGDEVAQFETRVVPENLMLKTVPEFAWNEEEDGSTSKEEKKEEILNISQEIEPKWLPGVSCEIILTPEALANFAEFSGDRSDVYWRNNTGTASEVYFTCALVVKEVRNAHLK